MRPGIEPRSFGPLANTLANEQVNCVGGGFKCFIKNVFLSTIDFYAICF